METKIKDIISFSDAPVYDLGAVADGLYGQELTQFLDNVKMLRQPAQKNLHCEFH